MAAFTSKLVFQDDGGLPFTLVSPLGYVSAVLGREITVPAGFRTDLASIPRPLWVALPPVGRYDAAAVVHDWLYQTGGSRSGIVRGSVTRSQADSTLLEAMRVLGVGWWTRSTIYAGVRAGGWVVWGRYIKTQRSV